MSSRFDLIITVPVAAVLCLRANSISVRAACVSEVSHLLYIHTVNVSYSKISNSVAFFFFVCNV